MPDPPIETATNDLAKLNAPTPVPPTPAEEKKKEAERAKLDAKIEARLQEKPKDAKVQSSAAGYYMQRGDNARAAELAERGLALARPGGDRKLTSRLLVTRGLLRYIERDFSGAHSDGKIALNMDPKNWAAFELYMYSLDKWPRGKRSLALAAARRAGGQAAASEGAQEPSLRPGSGAVAREDGAAPAAAGGTAPAPTQEELTADRERASRLMALQTPGLARTPEEWQARQDAAPSATYEVLMKSMKARKGGELSSALSLAEAAARADPADPMVYANRALILNQMGDSAGAVLDLSRVIAKGWKWPLAFKLRADALFKTKKWRAAMSDAELAAKLDPSDADAWFILGMSRSMLGGDPALALAELDRAAALKPSLAPFRDSVREKLAK
ncbi:MAG: hypothetical protein AAB268_05880 [Elusimicrobiota bacterium]